MLCGPAGAFCQLKFILITGEGAREALSGDCALPKSCVPQRLSAADSLELHPSVSPVRKEAKSWLELPGQTLRLVQNCQGSSGNSKMPVDRQAPAKAKPVFCNTWHRLHLMLNKYCILGAISL